MERCKLKFTVSGCAAFVAVRTLTYICGDYPKPKVTYCVWKMCSLFYARANTALVSGNNRSACQQWSDDRTTRTPLGFLTVYLTRLYFHASDRDF